MNTTPVYVLGVGLSHDGSACLLKDGAIAVAIEKERITRIKHDGANDTHAINYCLAAEGISLKDISVVVQNSNFGAFEYGNDYFLGDRVFRSAPDVPVVTISHHLAHAYNALGTCPFEETDILVIDGCGNFFDECIDTAGAILPQKIDAEIPHVYAEKDSFYSYSDNRLKAVYKDFSPLGMGLKHYPMHPPITMHSIGGLYSAVSFYCLNGFDDIGKLMGLSPFGRPGIYEQDIFELVDGRVLVRYDWMKAFQRPCRSYAHFKSDFQYYADIAYWVQRQVEKAILYVIDSRSKLSGSKNLAYSGGVALNAVANAMITSHTQYEQVYMTPSAGDNGIAIGCAYYGWLEVLKRQRVMHDRRSYFGKTYSACDIRKEIENYLYPDAQETRVVTGEIMNILPAVLKGCDKLGGKIFRVNIEDDNIYSIECGPGARVHVGATERCDALLHIKGVDFVKCACEEGYFERYSKRPGVRMSDAGHWSIFFHAVSGAGQLAGIVASLSELFRKKMTIECLEGDAVCARTASLLAEGKVIGWFQGKSEFGPRALGNRSILADPRKTDIQEFVNARIKFREDFRPFAPSVIREEVSRYFHFEGESPYMILVAKVRTEWKEKIPGVVHRDESSRIQTVTAADNPRYYQLLREFGQAAGIPVLLNTSFNRKGMPIVETPREAIDFFLECELDCLVMDNYIISKA